MVLDGDGATVAGLRFWGIGDPRYTPDKSEQAEGTEQERAEAFAPEVAEGLVDDEPPPVDVALVHDRRMADDLGGLVPLVLAGHGHEPDEAIDRAARPRRGLRRRRDTDDDASSTTEQATTSTPRRTRPPRTRSCWSRARPAGPGCAACRARSPSR